MIMNLVLFLLKLKGFLFKYSYFRKFYGFISIRFWFFYKKLALKSFKGRKIVTFSDFDTDFKIVLDRKNGFVDEMIFATKTYERHILRIIKENSSLSGVFLDLGANIGAVSLFASFYFKTVFSFEPLENFCDQFEESIKLNGLNNIVVYRFGCYDAEKKAVIAIPTDNKGGSSLIFDEKISCMNSNLKREVSLIKLDDFLFEDVDFVKLDVEGVELNCLRGMEKILRKCKPKIISELTFSSDVDRNVELIEFLFGLGYRVFVVELNFKELSRSNFVSFLNSPFSISTLFCE